MHEDKIKDCIGIKNEEEKDRKIKDLNHKYSKDFEKIETKFVELKSESLSFFNNKPKTEKFSQNEILTTENLKVYVKDYQFCTMDNSPKKTIVAILVLIILLINAYVNIDSYLNIKSKFQNTQYILYNNTYMINSNYIENYDKIDFKGLGIITNLQEKNNLNLNKNSDFDINMCSKLNKEDLKIINNLYFIIKGRYAFLLLSNLSDMISLFFLFISLFPNRIYNDIEKNSILGVTIIYFLGNFNSLPVLGYSLFKLDDENKCFVKISYFEYFYLVFILYGMYYAVFLFLNIIYFVMNKIYKLVLFIIFVIFPFFPFWSLCLEPLKKLLLEYFLKWQFLMKIDISGNEKRISSIILWMIISLSLIICLLAIINFSILRFIQFLTSERTSYISYASIFSLFLSILTRIIVYYF